MKVLSFRTPCGAAGDMILASLLDLGVDIAYLREQLGRLGIEGLTVDVETAQVGGITCSRLKLDWSEQKSYRHLSQIMELIADKGYAPRVVERCDRVLRRLAEAEAAVHGIPVERVHFHEIGAVDTIIDTLGSVLALEWLGVERVVFADLTVGHGTIACEHGVMPVPVPATARMLEGFRFSTIDVPTEILTPTGCALLTALGEQRLEGLSGTLVKVGYGCGTKRFERYPNAVRAELVECDSAEGDGRDTVAVLQSDMDHLSGEVMAFAAEELLAGGALDVSWSPLQMKKGRPGYRLTLLARPGEEEEQARRIMRQTRSLGVRCYTARRFVAERSTGSLPFAGGELEVKACRLGDHSFTKPEYESLAALARERGVPLIDLLGEFGRAD